MSTLRVGLAPASQEQKREEAMIEICCEWYEQALAAGIMRTDAGGRPYLCADRKLWVISFCPFCAAEFLTADSTPENHTTQHERVKADLINAVAAYPKLWDAAQALGISRTTLYYRLRKYNLAHLMRGRGE